MVNVKGCLVAFVCAFVALCSGCDYLFAQQEIVSGSASEPSNARASPKANELTAIAELKDGSRIVGTPLSQELQLTTSVGVIKVQFQKIKQVQFDSEHGEIVVLPINGDRLSGKLDPPEFKMSTSWGEVSLPIEQIQTLNLQHFGDSWDFSKDFSTETNPNGAWTYGWAPTPGAEFTPCHEKNIQDLYPGWKMGPAEPSIWTNKDNQAAYGVQPGEVTLHPGPDGQEAVVRWHAAKSCTIAVKGVFGEGDTGLVSVRIRHNTKTLFESVNTAKDEPFSLEIDMKSGDNVDFAVSPGRNGYGYCNTPLKAVITVK